METSPFSAWLKEYFKSTDAELYKEIKSPENITILNNFSERNLGIEMHMQTELLCPEKRVKTMSSPVAAIFTCKPYLK